MRFIFRPLSRYAIHTRKWCQDIAGGIKGNGVVRRVLDGFLLQVAKRNGTAIADVIDMPADFYVAGFETIVVGPPTLVHLRLGYRIASVEGSIDAGNMTWALIADEFPVYTSGFDVKWVGPKNYLSTSDKAWASFGWNTLLDLPSGDAYLTYTGVGRDSTVDTASFKSARIYRVKPAPPETTQPIDQTSIDGDPPTSAGAWSILHVDLDATGIDADHRFGETAVASFYSSDVGYLAYFGMPFASINGGYNDENPQIAIARIELQSAALGQDRATAMAIPLAVFGKDDLLPEDAPVDLDWSHPGPFGGAYTLKNLNGDYNPEFPGQFVYDETSPEPGDGASRRGYAMFEGLQKTFATDAWGAAGGYWAEQPACVAHGTGVDLLFTVVTDRPAGLVSATYDYDPGDGGPVTQVTMHVPEDWSRYNHTATYLLKVGADGSKTALPVYRSTYAIHDPALRDSKRGVYTPVFSTLVVEEEQERSLFACVVTKASPGVLTVSGDKFWFTGVAPKADDVGLELIWGDGTVVEADLGTMYPVFYPAMGGVPPTALKTGYSYGKSDVRFGYGSYDNRYPRANFLRHAPVCWYAPGMLAVIAAPRDGFLDSAQVAKLLVIRASDGGVVAESEFTMPFTVEQGSSDFSLEQWSVTCVQQGILDDDGELEVYAKLLVSKAVKDGPSFVYRADDLSTLKVIGVWGNPGLNYIRGPVYYLGTPLAPAKAGRATGRSFLAGNAVAAP